jgi:hypothetical protein
VQGWTVIYVDPDKQCEPLLFDELTHDETGKRLDEVRLEEVAA